MCLIRTAYNTLHSWNNSPETTLWTFSMTQFYILWTYLKDMDLEGRRGTSGVIKQTWAGLPPPWQNTQCLHWVPYTQKGEKREGWSFKDPDPNIWIKAVKTRRERGPRKGDGAAQRSLSESREEAETQEREICNGFQQFTGFPSAGISYKPDYFQLPWGCCHFVLEEKHLFFFF